MVSPGPKQSRIGHFVRDKRRERDLRAAGHDVAMANALADGGVAAFDPARFGARKLGEGAYGAAYVAQVTADVAGFLESLLMRGVHRVLRKVPRAHDAIVVKVARGSGARFVDDSVREASVHKHLSGPCARTRCGRACAPVPEFYFSGMARDSSGGYRYYTIMGVAEGRPLHDAMPRLDARLYVEVERAAAAMWLAGVLHADFHGDNALVGPDGRVTVIDFGFAVVVPSALRNRVRRAVESAIDSGAPCLGRVWDDLQLTAYANRVQHARDPRVEWYNPEGKALEDLFSRLPPAEAARVPALRKRAWGCK